jgi:tetratricopeptide (TPR) repeat protein
LKRSPHACSLSSRLLQVDAIITGRVTQQGDTFIVQADLLSAADGSQVWGARYSRTLSDIFAVQEETARGIAEKLRLRLTGEERQALAKRYTGNIKAYQNYLLGWTYLQRRTRQDFFTAISYFEKAIGEEPNYALAHAALTEAYISLAIRGFIAPDEGRRKAEEAARTALFLDPNLAEAHAAIGETRIHFAPFDFSTGDHELRRAIELSPSLDGHPAVIMLCGQNVGRRRYRDSKRSRQTNKPQRSRVLENLEVGLCLMKRCA